jgi:hypothetical protein
MLEEHITEKQSSVFLWARGLHAKDVQKEMFPAYGGKCLSCKAVHKWVEKYSQGHLKVADDARPVCPVEIVTEANAWFAYSIMHDCLKFWKVCEWWVPRKLKDWKKRGGGD